MSLRVLFVPFGSEGDLNPLLWVADGMAARGHTPIFLGTPHYRRQIEERGFQLQPIGTEKDFEGFARNPLMWHPKLGPKYVIKGMMETFPSFREGFARIDPPPDLVITSTLGLAAAALAQAHRIPWITLHMQPSVLRSMDDCPYFTDELAWLPRSPRWIKKTFFWLVDCLIWRMAQKPLNDFRKGLGLPPLHHFYDEALNGAEGIGAMFPAWYAPAQKDWPARARQFDFPIFSESRDLPAPLDEFLQAGSPPIVWTHGSANFDIQHFQQCALRATEKLGDRCLLVSLDAPRHDLPPWAFHATHVRFEDLFPRCKLAVHHGGIGTTAKCVAAGIPQLIIPRSHDQPDNAFRIDKLGLGRRLHYRDLDSSRLQTIIRETLDSTDIARRCRKYQQAHFPSKGPSQISEWAEEIAARGV